MRAELWRPMCALLILCCAHGFPNDWARAQNPAGRTQVFDVATIKVNRSEGGWRLQPTLNGYTGMRVTLRMLIQEAYGNYDDALFSGGPSWIGTEPFDLEAKFDAATMPGFGELTLDERRSMLRALLVERFQLKLHHQSQDIPVYKLVVGKSGSKLKPTRLREEQRGDVKRSACLVKRSRPGFFELEACTIPELAGILRQSAGRQVQDASGLAGRYDLELAWTPGEGPVSADDTGGPSLFTAVQEQLGLRLQAGRAPLDALVVDFAEQPSAN